MGSTAQDVLIELGARLGLPAFTNAEGGPRFPEGYKDYIALHERAPGVGRLGKIEQGFGEAPRPSAEKPLIGGPVGGVVARAAGRHGDRPLHCRNSRMNITNAAHPQTADVSPCGDIPTCSLTSRRPSA